MRILIAILLMAQVCVASGIDPKHEKFAQKETKNLERAVRMGRLSERTNHAITNILYLAVVELRWRGKYKIANKIWNEWNSQYSFELGDRKPGDHEVLSKWIGITCEVLKFQLGTFYYTARIDDLENLNVYLPVVFSCVATDVTDYQSHFTPFLGIVVYWGAFFSCAIGTAGTAIMLCAPASTACEYLTVNTVAEPSGKFLYNLNCKE